VIQTGTDRMQASPIALRRHDEIAHPERGVARGQVVRVNRGVYASAADWKSLPTWQRYLARVHAVAMLRPDAVFSHESAAVLQGLPVLGRPIVVHVLAASTAAARVTSGVRVHTTHGERELVDLGGVFATSPLDTAVDLSRHRHPAFGLAVADAVLRGAGDLTPDALLACNEARRSSRGRGLARWPLSNADAASESPLESVSRACVGWLGFPPPLLQVVFQTAGVEDRADFVWEEHSVLGESDGDVKYGGALGDPVEALRLRRERDTRLGEHVRAIAHWGWAEATAFAPLRRVLLGLGVPIVAPEATALLLSMRRQFGPRLGTPNPRSNS
jgi:hypothetical protein